MGAAITIRELTHIYPTPDGPLTVLRSIDLEVPAAGYVALTGPSGAGKSTLLSVIGGLEAPQSGSVRVGAHELARLSGAELATYRRVVVGFVFQHFGLLETLTALENVELAGILAGEGRSRRRQRARLLLEAVGVGARAGHRPLQLSGGERQRVAIARALANQPQLVLADEPTGNLDEQSADAVVQLLESLPAEHGCTLVVVTHNRAVAARAAQRIELDLGSARRAP
jgi:putative ABC transport system ATP-binding protein